MAEPFTRTYTDAQRDALAQAFEDRRIRPAARVVALAEAGELVEGLAPFKVNGGAGTVRDLAHELRKRRAADYTSELAKQPPRDAIENLRRRLVTVADEETHALERQSKGERDPEKMRQLARAIREAAAIPGPPDPTPPRPGHGPPHPETGKRGGATRGGIAGGILAQAHRDAGGGPVNTQGPLAAHDDSREGDTHGQRDNAAHDHDARTRDQSDEHDSTPGGWARAVVADLGGIGLEGAEGHAG